MTIEQFIEPIQLKKIRDIEVSEKVFKKLTAAEMQDLKNELAQKQIFLSKRNNYLKMIRDGFKTLDTETLLDNLSKLEVVDFGEYGTKILAKQIADITIMLDEKGNHIDEKLYGIADYEQGIMVLYYSDGNYSYHRDLADHEKMTSMFNKNLKISNNE